MARLTPRKQKICDIFSCEIVDFKRGYIIMYGALIHAGPQELKMLHELTGKQYELYGFDTHPPSVRLKLCTSGTQNGG